MLDPLSVAVGYLAEKGADKMFDTVSKKMKRQNPLLVSEVCIGQRLPYRSGLKGSISKWEIECDCESEFWERHSRYLLNGAECRLGYCDIRFRVQNVSRDAVSIRGLGIDKVIVEPMPESSFLAVSQGGGPLSECIRFAIDLDEKRPTQQRFEWINGRPEFIGSSHYFDDSSIELSPNETVNIELILRTEIKSYSVSTYLRYEAVGASETVAIPLENMPNICPKSLVPEDQRYRSTFSREAPQIAIESSRQFPQTQCWLLD